MVIGSLGLSGLQAPIKSNNGKHMAVKNMEWGFIMVYQSLHFISSIPSSVMNLSV
jgi:hypothetical protein